jgi:hypothetical protein
MRKNTVAFGKDARLLLESLRQQIISAAKMFALPKTKAARLGAFGGLALAAMIALSGCPNVSNPEPPPRDTDRNVTLTIKNGTTSIFEQGLTLNERQATTASFNWSDNYRGANLTASVSGETTPFDANGTGFTLNINAVDAGTELSYADLTNLVDEVSSKFAPMNVGFSHNIGDNITPLNPGVYYTVDEERAITIDITIPNAASPGNVQVTLKNNQTTNMDFTWIKDYQNYTAQPRTPPTAIVGGDATAIVDHNPTLKITFKAPDGQTVELSTADENALKNAVQTALDNVFSANQVSVTSVRGTGIILPLKNEGLQYNDDQTTPPPPSVDISETLHNSNARLTMPSGNNVAAVLDIGLSNVQYPTLSSPAAFNLPGSMVSALANANSITVNFASSASADISLAYVHYLRSAISTAKLGITITAVNAPTNKFTPVFDSRDWWATNSNDIVVKDLYTAYSSAPDYSSFSGDGIEIVNGIKVFKDSTDHKYMIAYDRPIKASEVALGVGNQYVSNSNISFHNFGLKKEANGNISPIDNNPILIHGGHSAGSNYLNNAIDFTTYKSLLDEAGLSPTSTMKPEHKVVISGPGAAGPNVAENGMYDFILVYYNPGANDTGAHDRARLPSWPTSGLTFDGAAALPAGVTSRNIGGQTADSMSRKGAAITSGTPATHVANPGEPRTDFINNITVPMANYLISDLHVSGFKNTNIIGNADKWSNYSNSQFHLIPTTNIGLIGNYGDVINLSEWQGHGVLDIVGTLPQFISMTHDYYNLWSDVSRETSVNKGSNVVYLHGSGGEYIVAGDSNDQIRASVVISKRYTNAPSGYAATYKPYYRAFFDVSNPDDVRLTGPGSDFDAKYLGSNSAQPIPALDEAVWIAAGNSGTMPSNLAANYSALSSTYKLINQAELDGFNVSVAAPAQPSNIRLAGGSRAAIEAVLPSKPKKSRFEEAYLAALWKNNERMI